MPDKSFLDENGRDAIERVLHQWKGPAAIRAHLTARGYRAHLRYAELIEQALGNLGLQTGFLAFEDQLSLDWASNPNGKVASTLPSHPGFRAFAEQSRDGAARRARGAMDRELLDLKAQEFVARGLSLDGWTGKNGGVMPLLQPLLQQAGFKKTRIKLQEDHAGIRMVKPVSGDVLLYCSAVLGWTTDCTVALPTQLCLVEAARPEVWLNLTSWRMAPAFEGYRLFGMFEDTERGTTRIRSSPEAAIICLHAFADYVEATAVSLAAGG